MLIVILCGSFADLTAAYELKRELRGRQRVTVIDKHRQFVVIPSLSWTPFGWRKSEQLSFLPTPALSRKGIDLVHAVAERFAPQRQVVEIAEPAEPAAKREIVYDYLLIGTGPHVDFSVLPGLGAHGGYTQSLCTAEHAVAAGQAWQCFLRNPGRVIIGATQNSSCIAAAYELVCNLEYAFGKAGMRERTPFTFLTAEPFAGHFGIGGLKWAQEMTERFFRHTRINWVRDAVLERVAPGEVQLRQGRRFPVACHAQPEDMSGQALPFEYATIIAPVLGVEAVRRPGSGNDRGFIVVDDYFRHTRYPNICAAGISVAVAPLAPRAAGCSLPRTGRASVVMAKCAARNIVASLQAKPLIPKRAAEIDAKCALDAGNQGIIMYSDRSDASRHRQRQLLIPGPWAHWMRVAFEQYFLWKMRTGRGNWR